MSKFNARNLRNITGRGPARAEAVPSARTAESLRATYRGHDRVFVISDMQTFPSRPGTGDVTDEVPRQVPLYGFNLGGYRYAAYGAGSVNRHEFGGLTDATFRMIPLIDGGKNADWPF